MEFERSPMPQYSRRQFFSLLAGSAVLAGCGSSADFFVPPPANNPQTSFDADTQAQLNAAMDQVFAGVESPGLMASVRVGSRAWDATRGTTTLGGATPASLGLYTRIGSITKTMTGTVILQLIEEGQLSFEDTLSEWYPTIEGSEAISIRDLGSMSSGFESYTFDPTITDSYFADPEQAWDPETLLFAGASLTRRFDPGQGFYYCNTNFVALGLIAEKILGQDLAEIFEERIFTPLGMTQSSYPYGLALPDPHWSGYTVQGSDDNTPLDATNWSPTFAAGAGEAASTLRDLSVWVRALGVGTLLSPAIQAERLEENPFSVSGVRAYCFAVGIDNGWIAHDGEIPGFNAQVAYLPALDASIVVTANADIRGADGKAPAAAGFAALAAVIAPNNVP